MLSRQLSIRIREHGYTMQDFCKNVLQTDYRTFQHRMRTERYYPSEVVLICMMLKDRCENIFGKTFEELVILQGTDHVSKALKEMIDSNALLYSQIVSPQLRIVHAESGPSKFVAQEQTIGPTGNSGPGPHPSGEPVKPVQQKKEKIKDPAPQKTEEEFKFEFIDVNMTGSALDDSRMHH